MRGHLLNHSSRSSIFSSRSCQHRLLQAIAVIDTGVHFPCGILIKLCLQSISWHNYRISSFSSRHLGCPFPLYVVHTTVSSVSKNVVDVTSFRHSYCPLIHSRSFPCFFNSFWWFHPWESHTTGIVIDSDALTFFIILRALYSFSNSEIRWSLEIGIVFHISSLAEAIVLKLLKIYTAVVSAS